MSDVKSPISLRMLTQSLPRARAGDLTSVKALSVAAALASSVSASALAQSASTALPPVKVDAPREKPRAMAPAKPKPIAVAQPHPAHHPAVNPQAAGQRRGAPGASSAAGQGAGSGGLPILATAPNANPYADPAAPYKVDRLSSTKFTEPVLNTPRTITVLTKEVLDDKNAFTLREIGRSTAGVTLGTGEGGNAFGDRFFHSRFRRAQRHFRRRHSRPRRQHSRELLYRAGGDSTRPGIDIRRTRHRRRRDQHRHETGDRSRFCQSHWHRRLFRPHAADHARREQGDQPDPRGASQRAVP